MGFVKRLFLKIKQEGLKNLLIDSYTLVYEKYYDKKYNLDTYSWVANEDLDVNTDSKKHASMYMASKAVHLRKMFKLLNLPKDKVIVDIGSGKGRVLLMASEFGFKEARGVEFSANLCEIARKNIENYSAKKKPNTTFKIYNEDAKSYQFKDDEYVFYLYNPFNAVILTKVIDNILESLKRNPREIVIIYTMAASKQKLVEERFNIKNRREFLILGGDYIVYDI